MEIDNRLYKYVANEESYPDGAVIIEEGSHGDWIYIVLEGQVKVKKETPKGQLTITTLKTGSVFGELIFLQRGEGNRTASIVADGPVTVGLVDMERLEREFRDLSPLLKQLISVLAKRLQQSTVRLVDYSLERRS